MKFILPIGSVVSLKNKKRVMVCGYFGYEDNEIQLYRACSHPNGYNDGKIYLFNEDDIDTLYFIGAQDMVSVVLRKELLNMKDKLIKGENFIDIFIDLDEKYSGLDLSAWREKIDEEINTTDYYAFSDFDLKVKEDK